MKKSQLKGISGASKLLPLMLLSISGFCVCISIGAAIAQKPATSSLAANAAISEPIKASLARKKIIIKAGIETLENADVVKPGDVIEESVTYSNVSDQTISKFVAQLPVPSNTELIVNSLKPSAASASLDGTQYAAIPLKRAAPHSSKNNNAAATLIAVPLNEYRYLRWAQNEITPGKSLTVSARFRVLSNDLNIQPAKNDVAAISPSSLGANK
jgi:hypothetical protein